MPICSIIFCTFCTFSKQLTWQMSSWTWIRRKSELGNCGLLVLQSRLWINISRSVRYCWDQCYTRCGQRCLWEFYATEGCNLEQYFLFFVCLFLLYIINIVLERLVLIYTLTLRFITGFRDGLTRIAFSGVHWAQPLPLKGGGIYECGKFYVVGLPGSCTVRKRNRKMKNC